MRFELTDQTRSAIDGYLMLTGGKPGQVLFCGRDSSRGLTARQYAKLVNHWVASIGLDPLQSGTHSLRRTKAVLIYRQSAAQAVLRLDIRAARAATHKVCRFVWRRAVSAGVKGPRLLATALG